MIKSCDHQSSSLFFEEADVCVRIVSGPSVDSVVSSSGANSWFEVRPRQACGACVCTG